jgi:NADP-dependent 3-hydroxy acid dehydrogenase YdfG
MCWSIMRVTLSWGPVIDLSVHDLRLQFETNVIGLAALTKAVAPHMVAKKSGLIVNISSVSGVCATPFAGAYGASEGLAAVVRGRVDRDVLSEDINLRHKQKIVLVQAVGYPQ